MQQGWFEVQSYPKFHCAAQCTDVFELIRLPDRLLDFSCHIQHAPDSSRELTLDVLLLADGHGDAVRLVVLELQLFAFFTGTTSGVFFARLLFLFKRFVLPWQYTERWRQYFYHINGHWSLHYDAMLWVWYRKIYLTIWRMFLVTFVHCDPKKWQHKQLLTFTILFWLLQHLTRVISSYHAYVSLI